MSEQGQSATPGFDAVVLAGGAGRRMGGVSKADLDVGGHRLLDLVLGATAGARRTVVVGPVQVPEGVVLTSEEPPGQGPVAGIAAGLEALDEPADWVLVLACDLPGVAAAAGPLLTAAAGAATMTDGVCLSDDEGHLQWLAAAYRHARLSEALAGLGPLDGVPVKAMARRLTLDAVSGLPARAWTDVDTWDGLRRWGPSGEDDRVRLRDEDDPG